MLEIEIKFLVADAAGLLRRLSALAAVPAGTRTDEDTYFNAPHRDFAQTDEAFRLRQIGEQNQLTYKGPRLDAETKTRQEIEVPMASGAAAAQELRALLIALGFRPVAVVRKQRTSFELSRNGFTVHITVDDVEHVGLFAELEVVAEESLLEAARPVLWQLATELGLTRSERRSYLELLLAKTQA